MKTKWAKMSVGTKTVTKSKDKGELKSKHIQISVWEALDHWVILQLLAVFSFSFAVGILFMHGTILWHQYKHDYGLFGSSPIPIDHILTGIPLEKYPNVKNDIYEWSQGQLRVNTSIFVR